MTERSPRPIHGLRMRRKEGELGFEVIVGGGLGRTPMIGKVIRDFLPLSDLLPYAEAIVHVYNRLGRRDNKYKARIKIMVHEHGVEDIRALAEEAFTRIKPEFAGADTLLAQIKTRFRAPICVPAKHRPSIRPIATTRCSALGRTQILRPIATPTTRSSQSRSRPMANPGRCHIGADARSGGSGPQIWL